MKKTTRNLRSTSLVTFLLLSMTLHLSSCGKKSENKTNANDDSVSRTTSGIPLSTQPNTTIPTFDSNQIDSISTLKNNLQCPNGQRLSTDYVYYTQGYNHNGTRTTISGPFQEGSSPGGSSQKLFVGVSSYNDIMFVSKLTNGSQVVGYAVIISYCSYSSNGVPYIDNSRGISGFSAPQGIVLDEDNMCGYGSVDSAQNTRAQSSSIPFNYGGYNVQLPPYNIYTTFRKTTCNGQY